MVTNPQSYREKVSLIISWGHWFTLFNILFALLLGSRYLFVADWPPSLPGRIYAIVSWIGHFSFLGFALYLLTIFPLTFIVLSQRLLRLIAIVLATTVLLLLLLDIEIFARFHLHLNPMVWELVVDPDQGELSRDWQLMFICVPIIFLIEMLFGTWSWQKLRSLNRQQFGKPLTALFTCAFLASHLLYIWADANFYRPITMQRASLPLSYPMTARRFLEKYGLLNVQKYQEQLSYSGRLEAITPEYPLTPLSFFDKGGGYNLLLIIVDKLHAYDLETSLPLLAKFAHQNIDFRYHYSSGDNMEDGLFGLFYGIFPYYQDGILAGRKPSALITALSQQGYQFGLFSSDGFASPLYRQALLTDFSLPKPQAQSNVNTITQWQKWFEGQTFHVPWFAYLNLNSNELETQASSENKRFSIPNSQQLDQQIHFVLETLKQHQQYEKTVIIVTSAYGGDVSHYHGLRGLSFPYSRSPLRVPLIIHWPKTPAQSIHKLTNHEDIMATLMQRLLHVNNRPTEYTQGEDLFAAIRKRNWLALSHNNQLVILTPTHTIIINSNGHSHLYPVDSHAEITGERLPLSLVLQVFTEIKRFIAN